MPQQFIGQSSSSLNNNINTAVILAAGAEKESLVVKSIDLNL